MATIPMIPLHPSQYQSGSYINTGRGIAGSGGDDFLCGHCGALIMQDYDPSETQGNPLYQCGFCENFNTVPTVVLDQRPGAAAE
jgi:hypothetical protein